MRVTIAAAGAWLFLDAAGAALLDIMPSWFKLLLYFGLPLAQLIIVARYHIAVVAAKDAEIKRLNDALLTTAMTAGDRIHKVALAAASLAAEAHETLDEIAKE